jgi:hypothetical protein
MDDEYNNDSDIKKEINNIIWMYGDKDMTLNDAENIACVMFYSLTKEYELANKYFNLLLGNKDKKEKDNPRDYISEIKIEANSEKN